MYSIDIKSRNQLRHIKTNKSQQHHGTFPLCSASQVKGCNLSEAIPGGLQQAISAAKASDAR